MHKGSRSIGENQRMRRGLPFRKAEIATATLGGEPGKGVSMDYLDVFKMVFGRLEGFVCLAFKEDMKSKAGPLQTFFRWPGEIEQIKAWVEERRSTNCYFCPHLLSKPIRKKEYALPGRVLWADLDECQPWYLGKYRELSANIEVETSPSRWQAYWILDHDISPKEYEDLNHRLAIGYESEGCDQGGWDLTQLLRIPGTTHNKGERFTVEVRAINWMGHRLEDFESLPSLPVISTTHRGVEIRGDAPPVQLENLRIPDGVKQYLISPPGEGERSHAAWAVMRAMKEGGYSLEQIFATIWASPLKERYSAFTLEQDVRRAFEKQGEVTAEAPPKGEKEEPTAIVADWRDIHLYLPEEGEPIIEGLLIGGSQGKMQIAGQSKMGKTTLGLNVIIPIALPCPVFGALRVPRRRRATFVDLEAVAAAVQTQTILLTKTYGEPERGWLTIIAGENFRIKDTASMNRLWAKLKEAGAEVVFMDSIINLVDDYNDPIQSKDTKEWLQSLMSELHCALIIANHVAAGFDGRLSAFGALGKLLDKWVGSALLYDEILGLQNYGRLHGTTRTHEWSKIDLLLAYEQDTQVLSLVPWDEIPLPQAQKLKVIGPSPRTVQFQQFMILAKRRKLTGEAIAEMIGVSKQTMYRYNTGEDIPSEETWWQIQEAWRKLRGDSGATLE